MKPKKAPKKRAGNSRLSPKELRRLADKLVATKDPAEVSQLICVYVFLHRDEQPDEFFIFRLHDLQKFTLKSCFKGGKSRMRPKNPKSMHCAVWPEDIKKFRDDWGLIRKAFRE